MSLFLLTRPGDAQGAREAFAVDWIDAALRFLDERLAELEGMNPVVDVVALGGSPPAKSIAWVEVFSVEATPEDRNPNDGPADMATLRIALTCWVGDAAMRHSPLAARRVAALVRSHFDEWARTETVATDIGEARSVTVAMNRARVAEAQVSETLRAPAVFIDNGFINTAEA